MRLFSCFLASGNNVALVLKGIGMLVIEGNVVKMKFYKSLLQRLNGSERLVKALLGMPEMRDSVLSGTKTAVSQTHSGCVIVFPTYMLETAPRKTLVRAVKPTREEEKGKDVPSSKKGNVPGQCLLLRKRQPAPKLATINMEEGKGEKAEGKESHGSVLPAIPGCSAWKAATGGRKQYPEARQPAAHPVNEGPQRAGQVQQRTETQPRVQAGSILPPSGKAQMTDEEAKRLDEQHGTRQTLGRRPVSGNRRRRRSSDCQPCWHT
ncbi:coiled-coil domain-containing protein 81-like [Apteryx mantelli]|uniref:Coiled-coil domain-containing protein 81-like n=1 Tax=Apteryx mantelli TaxID=2696672 RepID=A0A8B7IHE0_9AVES|nr:PREDICTED: coiled-coil domain-containing protein 81-like [Apteryx mantelli mantelli]